MNKTLFSDVNDTKGTWSVVSKVLRKWVVKRKAAPYAVWKIGMLLSDEKGTRIEVSATHKKSIDKVIDDLKEGVAYNFKTIVEIQKGKVTDGGLIDVIGFLQAFGRLHDQRREFDNIKMKT
ncbi:hypothetical protein K1719_036103 [Acacia pycnantha]|nr:hypothetical protein K1719_036103 [Acacia pycnantha]